mmetsp:Transcript_39437/g.61481  ORF Transcript_39437/g.61481 Transcript_39437/m.61481 type:complete len:284 (+) Transcript_39437:60-911(+)|eukprot:CAMPEP_0184293702 /NCGR_PEP_ID=MMETSP1049-20130417/5061_1 /TAXON_ID=77928 /ORGANISM="Proteomonas sulcata, Strain CCMP704" /LENGTH=283 /DNA_ID=CAMNT_0026601747 /DNA_START=40 /DNA_END=891 /DNA_ORIENTATION=-
MPYSFLHIAAIRNDVQKAQALILGGGPDEIHVWEKMPEEQPVQDPVHVDERDHTGWTPLMTAATHGHVEMCKLLIDHQANVNARKNFSCSPLHLASRNGHKGVVETLISHKADVSLQKLDRSIVLHDAAFGGHIEVLRTLVAAFGKQGRRALNLQNDEGMTPLHFASQQGHPHMIKALLGMGASLHLENEDGKRPQDIVKNRRSLLAFPDTKDPVALSMQEPGAIPKEVADYQVDHRLKGGRRGSVVLGNVAHHKSMQRPGTGDVAKFTETLGMVRSSTLQGL